MKYFIALAIFAAVVICQTPPKEPSDFSAFGTLVERVFDYQRRFPGDIFEDFSNKRQRFDIERHPSYGGKFSIWRFYDKNLEYEYVETTKHCHKRSFNQTLHPAFDWVARSRHQGDCHDRHDHVTAGDLWRETINAENRRELCVAKNSTQTPLWFEHHHGRAFSRIEEFRVFTSGQPDASVFSLPASCAGK